MILNEETFDKFKYYPYPNGIEKFSNKLIIIKCDLCGKIFENKSVYIFTSRRNSKSEIDICNNIDCIKKKRENTMLQKYGVVNAGQSLELRNKVVKTCLKKYGVSYPMESKLIQNKSKTTLQKNYGVNTPMESEIISGRLKQTFQKKYNVNWSSQIPSMKEKSKNTSINRYGISSYTKTEECKKRIKQTKLEKYGDENYTNRDKAKLTCLEKYGVDNFSKTKERNEMLRKTNFINMFDKLINGERLNKLYKPLFTINDYNGVDKQYKFKCLTCNTEFFDNIDDGSIPECKVCYPPTPPRKSKMEIEILEFLKSLSIKNIETGNRTICNGLELDLYLKDYKIAIECNGNYWHSQISGNKNKKYHINKTELCEKIDVHLVQIFEDEWIYKKNIICERLKSILKIENKKIYARNCEVKEINNDEYFKFVGNVHLQGFTPANIKLGLFNNNELISIMSFGNLRKVTGNKHFNKNEYELIRYATSIIAVGGANKLLSHFIKSYKPKKIISYADRRWTFYKDNLYERIGFKKSGKTPPNYWYINKKKYLQRIHRFTFRKSELSKKLTEYDESLTEWQNMQLSGYDRIWDCGSWKYEMTIS